MADVLGIPFYVWDFADRFTEDVIEDFVSSYARGETPNPCVRCNERIKFSAVAARALALVSTPSRPVITPAWSRAGYAGLWTVTRTSLTCWGADRRATASCAVFPVGDTPKPAIRVRRPPTAGWRWPPSPTATTSASFRPATPGLSWERG